MLLSYVVPKLAVGLCCVPGVMVEKLPDYRPTIPHPTKDTEAVKDTMLKNYRDALQRIVAQRQELEAEPGKHAKEIAELNGLAGLLRERITRIEQAPPALGPWMPLVTGDQLRELRGLPLQPRKPPVRD